MCNIIATVLGLIFIALLTSCEEFKDAVRNFESIATKFGHPPQRYQVVTEDGYILSLFRLPGSRVPPILLQHGVLDTSHTWIVRGNESLGISLANAGYDVWMGNLRGNTLSRNHISLDPDRDAAFWDFSLEQLGKYDMAAAIDTILSTTGARRLNVIGHSLGNTVMYILGSMKPEYNEKINVMIALAPICYFQDSEEPIKWLARNSYTINRIFLNTNTHELFGRKTLLFKIIQYMCREPADAYEICLKTLLFSMSGNDAEEISPDFYYKEASTYFPAGVSRKVMLHFGQIVRNKRFIRFDYGRYNLLVYNSTKPLEFDLSKVTMSIVLVGSENDKLSLIRNVDRLRQRLPNVVDFMIHPRKLFNHLDFTWGQTTKYTLFPYIFKVLDKFNGSNEISFNGK